MRALSNLININTPNLVLFVGEALVGNDAVDQLVKFNRWVPSKDACVWLHRPCAPLARLAVCMLRARDCGRCQMCQMRASLSRLFCCTDVAWFVMWRGMVLLLIVCLYCLQGPA